MKSDIDHLMEEARLDALLVTGSALNNPAMTYFTGLVHMTDGDLLKKRGEEAVLCHYPMEREEAARSGLRTHDLGQYDINAMLAQTSGDRIQAIALRYQQVFEDLKLRRRVGVYGRVELGPALSIFRRLEQLVPDVELVGEAESKSAITRARATKDVEEVERIRKMGVITLAVASDVSPCGWRCAGPRIRKGRSSPLATTPGCHIAPVKMTCRSRWASRSSSTYFRARLGAAISMTSPAPGASVMPTMNCSRRTRTCRKCMMRSTRHSSLACIAASSSAPPASCSKRA